MQLRLDVLALQEIGDPVELDTVARRYGYHAARNGKERAALHCWCDSACSRAPRRVLSSGSDGRMCGLVLEHLGRRVVLVSVYMPTGLDFVSDAAGASDRTVDKLYRQLLRWTDAGVCDQAVVLGDLNETMSRADRSSDAGRHGRWVSCLPAAGFLDAYRVVHGTAAVGYTHSAKRADGALSQSRLDYVWARGWEEREVRQCRVVQSRRPISNHKLLWAELECQWVQPSAPEPTPVRLPNLRNASDKKKRKMVSRMHRQFEQHGGALLRLSQGDRTAVDVMVQQMSDIALDCASQCLGMTGAGAMRSKQCLLLERQRRFVASCRSAARRIAADSTLSFAGCGRWRRLHANCLSTLGHEWQHDPSLQYAEWLAEVNARLRSIRRDRRSCRH